MPEILIEPKGKKHDRPSPPLDFHWNLQIRKIMGLGFHSRSNNMFVVDLTTGGMLIADCISIIAIIIPSTFCKVKSSKSVSRSSSSHQEKIINLAH